MEKIKIIIEDSTIHQGYLKVSVDEGQHGLEHHENKVHIVEWLTECIKKLEKNQPFLS